MQSGASVGNHLRHLCYSRSLRHLRYLRTRKALSVGCNLQELRREAVRSGGKRCKLCEAVESGASVGNHLRHLCYSRSLRHLRYLRTRKALSVGCNLQELRREAVRSGGKRCKLCEAVESGASGANDLRHLCYSRSLRHLRYLRTRKALSVGCNLQELRREAVRSGGKRCKLCEAVESGASGANDLRHLGYSRSLLHLRYLRTRQALSVGCNLQQLRCEAVRSSAKR